MHHASAAHVYDLQGGQEEQRGASAVEIPRGRVRIQEEENIINTEQFRRTEVSSVESLQHRHLGVAGRSPGFESKQIEDTVIKF